MTKLQICSLRIACVLIGVGALCMAQDNLPPAPPDGRGRGTPPPPPEQRLLDRISTLITNDPNEWSVLEPKIRAIQQMLQQRERFTKAKPPPQPHPARRGDEPPPPEPEPDPNLIVDIKVGPNGQAPPGSINHLAGETYARLVMLASNPNTGQGDLVSTLNAFRAARAQSDAELAKARAELRQLVTTRQEIILVVAGILD